METFWLPAASEGDPMAGHMRFPGDGIEATNGARCGDGAMRWPAELVAAGDGGGAEMWRAAPELRVAPVRGCRGSPVSALWVDGLSIEADARDVRTFLFELCYGDWQYFPVLPSTSVGVISVR